MAESILIKDTTKEERIRIVQEGLSQCGGACDFATAATIWAADRWTHFTNRTSMAKRNCGN